MAEKKDNDNPYEPEHIEHSVVTVSESKPNGHKWVQKGTSIECPGDSEHYAHGFYVPASYVLREVKDNGELVFEDVVKGGFISEQMR